MIAAVMAAGRWKGETPAGGSSWRALTPLNGRPAIAYVVDALAASHGVDEVLLVGPPELSVLYPEYTRLEGADRLTTNVVNAAQSARGRGRLLLVGCDVPLLTPEAVDAMIAACADTEARLHYPIIEKSVVEARYPGMRRTYVRLRDGTYTGGNLILADPDFILEAEPRIQALFSARKSPVKLARLLGLPLLVRLLVTMVLKLPALDVPTAAQLIGRPLGATVAGISLPYPEIGADLDTLEEIPIYEDLLRKAVNTGAARHG